jgi:hypothetical protein
MKQAASTKQPVEMQDYIETEGNLEAKSSVPIGSYHRTKVGQQKILPLL